MSNQLPTASGGRSELQTSETKEFVTMTVGGQLFGIPVLSVQDVLAAQKIARIPLAPPEVAGALNLRGRIVTAIDVRTRLGLPPMDSGQTGMSIVVDHHGELYSLIIDVIGDVMDLPNSAYERSPATLDPSWREVAAGVYRLDGELLVVLDVNRLLDFADRETSTAA